MSRRTTLAGVFGHKVTALLLLTSSLLLPIAPFLEASLGAFAESCQCCRQPGATKCSHKSHRGSAAGPSLNADMECGSGCAPRAVVPSLSFFFMGTDSPPEPPPPIPHF